VHVGLNLVYLVPGETGGTETYARELIPALVAAAPTVRFTAFVNKETAASKQPGPWGELIPAVTLPVNARKRSQWVRGEQLHLPRAASARGVELLHSLANTGPATGRFRRVVTIQDLHYKLVPEAHLGLNGVGMRVLVPVAAKRSHRVIVPSRSTGNDVSRLLGVAAETIDVVPLGIGTRARAQPTPEAELRTWLEAGDRQLVLSVSAKRPHKNLARLISAVATIDAARRPLLVIPGYPTPHERELRHHAAELGVEGDIRLLDWVSDAQLEGLYATATCLICGSLHEGFGLPVLEAMARGVPVACSDRGALAEVAGEAAATFEPTSVEQIAAAIEHLLLDPAARSRLVTAGLERVRHFSWDATAAGTLATYRRAVSLASPATPSDR
jgi:glycosyltransferase involved in cell wall biosynthesis